MAPDKRDELYNNLINSGRVTENEIGTIDDFKAAITDEATAKEFHQNLLSSGIFTISDIGDAADFWLSIRDDFSQPTAATQPTAQQPTQRNMGTPGYVPNRFGLPTQQQGGTGPVADAAPNPQVPAQPLSFQERVQKSVGMAHNVGKAKADFSQRMSAIEQGNKPFSSGKSQQYDPTTGETKDVYYTTTGQAVSTPMERDIANIDNSPQGRIGKELEDAYAERDRLEQELSSRSDEVKADGTSIVAKIGAGTLLGLTPAGVLAPELAKQIDKRIDPQWAMLNAAKRANDKRIAILERDRDRDGFFRTVGKTLFDIDTWDFGANEIADAVTLSAAADKKLTGKAGEAQEALMRNTYLKQIAEQRSEDDTFMQRAGDITANAIPFVLEFILTGGGYAAIGAAGRRLGAKAAAKIGAKGFAAWTMKNTGTLAGNMLSGLLMANTTGLGKTAADIMGRRQGVLTQDENGEYVFRDGKSWGRSVYEGEMAQAIEYFTEHLGNSVFDKALGKWVYPTAGKLLTKGLDKLGASKVSEIFSRMSNSQWAAILDKGGIQGYPSEVLEEGASIVLNSLLVGDNQFSDLWDRKTLADILGGMALSIGFMQAPGVARGAYNTAQYYRFKHNTEKSDQEAAKVMGEQWEGMRDLIDNTPNEGMQDVIDHILDSPLPDDYKATSVTYAYNLMKLRGYNLRTAANAKDRMADTDENGEPRAMSEEETAVNEAFANGYEADEQQRSDISIEREDNPNDPQAQAAWQGVEDRIRQDAADRADQRRAEGERMAYKGSGDMQGMLRPLTINEDSSERDPQTGERKKKTVYLVNGTIAIEPNGNGLSREGTDKTIYVYDPETGDTHELDPFGGAGVLSVGDVISMEDYLADNEQQSQSEVQQAAETAQGKVKVNTPFETPQGRKGVVQSIEGDNAIVLFADGEMEQASMPLAEVQQYADALRRKEYEARHPQTPAEQPQQPNTATEGQTPTAQQTTPQEGGNETRAKQIAETIKNVFGGNIDRYITHLSNTINSNRKRDRGDVSENSYNLTFVRNNRGLVEQYLTGGENAAEDTRTPAQRTYDDVVAKLGADRASKKIDATAKVKADRLTKAQKALKTAQEAADNTEYGSKEEQKAEEAVVKAQAEYDAAQQDMAAWDEVRKLRDQALLAQAEQEEQQRKAELERKRAEETEAQRKQREEYEAEQARRKAEAEAAERRRQEENERLRQQAANPQPTEQPAPIEGTKGQASQLAIARQELADDPEALAMLDETEPRTLVEVAATLLASGKNATKLLKEDFKRETGYSDADVKRYPFLFAGADKGGITLARFGEMVVDAAREYGVQFDENDATAGIGAALELLGSVGSQADINDYITNSRIAEAYDYHNTALAAARASMLEAYGMTEGEYESYMSWLEDAIEQGKSTLSDEEFNQLFNVYEQGQETDVARGNQEGAETTERPEGAETDTDKNGERGNGETDAGTAEVNPAYAPTEEEYAEIKAYLDEHPNATQKELMRALKIGYYKSLYGMTRWFKERAVQTETPTEQTEGTESTGINLPVSEIEERFELKAPTTSEEFLTNIDEILKQYADRKAAFYMVYDYQAGYPQYQQALADKVGATTREDLQKWCAKRQTQLRRGVDKERREKAAEVAVDNIINQALQASAEMDEQLEQQATQGTAEGENQLVENFPSRGSKPAITRTHTYSPVEGETGIGVYSRVDTKTKSGEEVSRKEDYYVDLPLDINSDEDRSKYREIGGYRVYLDQGKLRLMDIPTLEEALRLKALAYATIKGENIEQQETPKQETKPLTNNEKNWREVVEVGVAQYSYVIADNVERSGFEFADEIRKAYDTSNPQTKAIVQAIEQHISSIKVRPDGSTQYKVSEETLEREEQPKQEPKAEKEEATEQPRAAVGEKEEQSGNGEKVKNEAAPKQKIDDVGEKIGGARKDLAQKMGAKINLDADTFPKMFPKFDLKKAVEQGLDPKLASSVYFLRIAAQKEYKSWLKHSTKGKALSAAKFFAAYAKQFLENGNTSTDFKDNRWTFTEYGKKHIECNLLLFEKIYEKFGNAMFDLDLAGYEINPIERLKGIKYFRKNEKGNSEEYQPAYEAVAGYSVIRYEEGGLDKAIDEVVKRMAESVSYNESHPYKLSHYYMPGEANSHYIGVKLGGKVVALTEKMSDNEASQYLREHEAELQEKAKRLDEERKQSKQGGTNTKWKPELGLGGGRARVGNDYRNGKDVSAEDFRKTFGFRGVEFGNYVTQAERQRFINEAYDAMMDLAALLNVSPRALSLGGRLGFAIGARGGGNAMAHYEPDLNVINLTKSKGAGSLAHEWWHALDYYFNRMGDRRKTPATANRRAEDFNPGQRREMEDAFVTLMEKINDSDYRKRSVALDAALSKDYYTNPTELGARAFQDYVQRRLTDKGQVNDFLSSFTPEEQWNGKAETYPYPTGKDADAIDERFDNLFGTMLEREDEQGNVMLYERADGKAAKVSAKERKLRDAVVDLLRKAGIDVVTESEEGQRVLDMANGRERQHRVYHGSGADFEAFDHTHMGEGEGAQAFGWGTYVTEVEGIGRTYAEAMGNKRTYKGKVLESDPYSDNAADRALFYMEQEHGRNNAIKFLKQLAKEEDDETTKNEYLETINVLRDEANWKESDRFIYTVEIPDDNGSNYLDWDKKASDKQTEAIKNALMQNEAFVTNLRNEYDSRNEWTDKPPFEEWLENVASVTSMYGKENGKRLYNELSNMMGSERAASEFLHSAGFVGIKYPADYYNGGRADNAKNYVIFNEGDLQITDKVKFFRTENGEAYGFTMGGKIYLDPKIATAETPIHEYTHLWAAALRQANPKAWEQLKNELEKDKDLMAYVQRLYPELKGDELMDEVFAHFSGRRGAERLRAEQERMEGETRSIVGKAKVIAMFENLRDALKKFWNAARELFAGKSVKNESAEDFADMVLADLLGGFNPTEDKKGKQRSHINPRSSVPNVRGGWNERKIKDYLKHNPTRSGVFTAARAISEFDNVDELKEHMFYHGTVYGGDRLKPSITMSEREAERYGGGGYGERYWGISLTKSKKVASSFSGVSSSVRIYPVILLKDAKVIERHDFEDTADVEEHIVELWNEGVDAVWIGEGKQGKGEQELCVLNPRAVVNIGTPDFYKVYQLGTKENPLRIADDAAIEKMYKTAKEYVSFPAPRKPFKPLTPDRYDYKDGEVVRISDEEYAQRVAEYEDALEKYNNDIEEYNNSEALRMYENIREKAKRDIRYQKTDSDVRFRGEEEPVFYSNAMRAVENIKQERATPEQWVKMIEKQGGMKAGEDKWLGLSEWLKGSDAKTLTKGEVLDYIRANEIQIEEVEYGEDEDISNSPKLQELNDEHSNLYFKCEEETGSHDPQVWARWAYEQMANKYGDDFRAAIRLVGRGEDSYIDLRYDSTDRISDEAYNYLSVKPINETRLQYTTEGLDNKREIVLTVPTIEPWNEHDEVHFGEAGGGRAVAWVRFGETTDADGKRVLVIDEIQSKRHQEGRERGYMQPYEKIKDEMRAFQHAMEDKYGSFPYNTLTLKNIGATAEEVAQMKSYEASVLGNGVPDAPFEKNWHEVAMKRMLRFAAENGYDKVAWTKGEQQAERYGIGGVLDYIRRGDKKDANTIPIEIKATNHQKPIYFDVDLNGNVTYSMWEEFSGKNLSDIVGKEIANKLLNAPDETKLEGNGLRYGGEGMKGFYDQILPRFMDKYGKKWGVKTGEVELPNIGDNGLTMWSVDVTDDMRESVMRGQPLFRPKTQSREGGEEAAQGEWYDRGSVERIGEFVGYSPKRIAAMNARQEQTARNKFRDAAEKLHLSDNITFADTIDDVQGLTDEQRKEWRRKKGWYSPRTGKIVIILGNHKSMDDVMKSILHEGVAHHGLRQMFGEHFNTFLDNVYRVASPEIRDRINTMAKKHGWDFREATEEYLAMLAEDTDFEKPENQSWWKQVKAWFIDLLHKIGFKLHDAYDTITDNELRYILWRSYENLVNPGRYNSVVEEAKDIAKQYDLKVGRWDVEWTIEDREPNATTVYNGRIIPVWATNGRRNGINKGGIKPSINLNEIAEIKAEAENDGFVAGIGIDMTMTDGNVYHLWVGADKEEEDYETTEFYPQDYDDDIPNEEMTRRFGKFFGENVNKIFGSIIGGYIMTSGRRGFTLSHDEIMRMGGVRNDRKGSDYNVAADGVAEDAAEYAKRDAEYMEAVNSGDMEKAQRMVNEAAKRAMPDTKVVDKNGNPLVVYHGTKAKFNIFRQNPDDLGFHFGNKSTARNRVGRGKETKLVPAFIKLNNPIVFDEDLGAWEADYMVPNLYKRGIITEKEARSVMYTPTMHYKRNSREANRLLKELLIGKGYDGIIYNNYHESNGSLSYAVFSPSQIKSADPVTYDDNGNVIPLSQRFNEGSDDIRFRDGEDEETGAPKPQARGAYERMVSSAASQWKEAMQDSMLSLKKLYQAVSQAYKGSTKGVYRIEDEKGYENAYLAENRMHSMSEAQIHAYQQDYMKPLQRAIHALTHGKREAYETLTDYMMAKHGLERNEVMAKREAKKAWEEKYKSEQGNPNYTATKNAVFANIDAGVDDLYLEYRKQDYAGLTALTGIEDVEEAEKEAQRMVDEYEQQHDTTDLWIATNRATRRSLFKMLESGLLSPERHAEIRDMYQYYIPLQGFDSDVAEDVYAYMGSDGTRLYGTTIRAAKGRKSKADDPIATIAMNGEAAIRRGNRNLMKQHFLRFVQSHPSDLVSINDVWLRKNANGEWEQYFDADLKETDTPEEVARKVRDFNERMEQEAAANPDLYKRSRDLPNVPFRVLNVRDMEQHQVMVQVDGKNYLLTINGNPRAAQALNGLTNPDVFTAGFIGTMMNATQSVVRTLSQFYTTRNPNFVLSNFLRDAVYTNSMVLAKESPNYALNFHKNFLLLPNERMGVLFASWENGKLREKLANGTASNMEKMFYDFMMNGGETGWTSLRDIEKHKRDLKKALKREGNIAASALNKLGDFFDITNRMIENHARFTAYVTSIEMGRSVERAVWDAKEISVNFNKKGAGDKFLKAKNQTFVGKVGAFVSGLGRGNYAFWNASLQGLNNIARIGKRNPAKFMAVATTLMGLGVAIPLLNALLGGDDDDDKNAYWNLPEYVRRSNICFRFTKDMPWITIPLPIEFRAIYGLGELGSGVALGKEYYSKGELTKQVAAQFSQVLPLDFMEGGGGWHCLYPTYIKPVIEAYSNQSWTGLPIYRKNTYGQYDVAPEWQRAYSNTNNQIMAATKWLNEATGGDEVQGGNIDFNPARIEYMLRGYLGGYFTVADQVIKMGETATGNREFEWRNMMLANRVVKEGDERTEARKLTNEYFNLKEEYDKTDKSLKAYKKKQDEGTLSVVGQAHYIALMNDSEEYGRYLVFGTYNPLFDAYYKQIKEANAAGDSEEAKRLERGQNELRREMVNIIHDMDNGGTFDRKKVATGINENLKKMQNDKLWDAQDKAINKSIEADNALNPTDNVEE